MTKVDIVERIYNRLGISKNESAELLETVFSIMKNTLEQGENLKISGFDNFEVKRKHDRLGRNPQTGEAITIAARHVLTFKPSAILKNCINQGNAS
ncbi:MAG: integration host factor subunit alpha [Geobacteraceae bacterium]